MHTHIKYGYGFFMNTIAHRGCWKDFNIDLENSILIGDKESDVEAGLKAEIKDCRLQK